MNNKLKRVFVLFLSSILLFSSFAFDSVVAVEENANMDVDMDYVVSQSSDNSYMNYKSLSSFENAVKDITITINKSISEEGVTFEIDVPADGMYNFGLSYKGVGEEKGDIVFGLKLDGKYPFEEAKNLSLYRIFTNAEGGNRVDGLGNQFAPKQVPYEDYYFDNVFDITRWSDDDYLFALTAGKHTVTLEKNIGDFQVEKAVFSAPKNIDKYLKPTDTSDYYDGKSIVIEAEKANVKTGYWLVAKSDNSSLDVTPNDTYNTIVNYIGGGNWKTVGQTLVLETPEMEAGYYQLGFSFRQNTVIGAEVYRSLKIDGICPFEEAGNIGFNYSYEWQQSFFADENNNPYLIYIPEGKHTLTLEVTSGGLKEVRDLLKEVVANLGDLYVDITMITGETVDAYRDYDLFTQIADMQERLTKIHQQLNLASKKLQESTGEKMSSYISIIDNMKQICKLMLDNKYTAHQYKNEYYSKYTSLASVLYEMSDMPLDLDKIVLSAPNSQEPFETATFFEKMMFSIKKFFVSFTADYDNISGDSNGKESITIWVNWGRDQAQVLNSLIQSDFTPKSGINVDVQIVNATVVQAVLSGKGPDCLLQHSRSEPVNLAMRGMLYNLKNFDDCDEVLKNFHEGAELPYYYKDGLYALPDTQQFYLMFYRTDIFEEMGLEVPETWEDFAETTKLLARNNLSVWLPNTAATSTAQADIGIGSINIFPTLLLQKGLDIYSKDGKSTNLSNSDVIETFGEWTDFYTKLKLPRTMDFYNRFRTGTCPIGISSYTLYTTLKVAAPEISGLWNVALTPGIRDENGNVNHTTSGGGTACSILNSTTNPAASWEFLKWWVSDDTQLAYSSEVESILGPTGRVSVSNLNAFKSLEWDKTMEKTIVTAMEQTGEIPEYPGSYYVSRSVYQAFWNVIENNQNTKKMILQYADEADVEIKRKWKQYENR